jgi:hypothetical protein
MLKKEVLCSLLVCPLLVACTIGIVRREAVVLDTPAEPTVSGTLPQPAIQCCSLAEGVFQTIWQSDRTLQAQLGCTCPRSPHHPDVAWHSQTAYQPFERGAMLRATVGMYSQPVIFILYADGSYQAIADTFDPATPAAGKGERPPLGLFEPKLGFGEVWHKEPGVREALGWATAAETRGAGYNQMFAEGCMIWVDHRQETYVFIDDEETYTVVNSPTFTLPSPTPDTAHFPQIFAPWIDRHLSDDGSKAEREFAFLPDGTITFHDCTGSYELIDGKILLDSNGCAAPELPTGLYEYAFDATGELLTLQQRFPSYDNEAEWNWERMTGGELVLRSTGWGRCYIDFDHTINEVCWTEIKQINCPNNASSPIVPAAYKSTFVGPEWILSREFVKSDE